MMMNPTEAIMIVMTTGLVLLCVFGLAIADYIVTALGVSGVARAKGIPNDWLAWLPVGQDWVLGSTVEKVDEARGIKRAWGKIFLAVSIAFWIGMVVFLIAYFSFIIFTARQSFYAPDAVPVIGAEFAVFYIVTILFSLI
ncbi:MAG: hypothetical protein IJO50_02790, partial [Clostridia bacterium]|nr:hypothetical protein [Clostridia bacterium]